MVAGSIHKGLFFTRKGVHAHTAGLGNTHSAHAQMNGCIHMHQEDRTDFLPLGVFVAKQRQMRD